MKTSRKPKHKIKPPKQNETDLILSSPKLLRGIEAGVKEMREGKLLTRDGKAAFKKLLTHAQKKTIAELKKSGLSYTEEQIFKMVS